MKKRLTATIMLIVYSVILLDILVFKFLPMIRIGRLRFRVGGTQDGPPNFIPFKTIWPYLHGEKGFLIGALNLAGNVILLVPVGFLLPFVYRNMTWKKMLVTAIASGLAIEALQAVLHVGIFDIDDVLLNGLGVVLGYWSFLIITKKSLSIKSNEEAVQQL